MLYQEQIMNKLKNQNKLVTSMQIKSVIKSFPKESPNVYTGKLYKTLKVGQAEWIKR
jgi:hypothetical protein